MEEAGHDLRRAPDGREAPLVRGLRGEHVLELIPGFHVFTLEEASLEGLNRLMRLEEDIFGEESLTEWYMVSHIHHGNVLVLVDAARRKTVGIAILMRDWDEMDKCYLADFGIRADYRGQGLGSTFLRKVLEIVREKGFCRVSLTVDTSNKPAIGLYRKHGFSVVGERRHLYGEGRHRYVMEIALTEREPE